MSSSSSPEEKEPTPETVKKKPRTRKARTPRVPEPSDRVLRSHKRSHSHRRAVEGEQGSSSGESVFSDPGKTKKTLTYEDSDVESCTSAYTSGSNDPLEDPNWTFDQYEYRYQSSTSDSSLSPECGGFERPYQKYRVRLPSVNSSNSESSSGNVSPLDKTLIYSSESAESHLGFESDFDPNRSWHDPTDPIWNKVHFPFGMGDPVDFEIQVNLVDDGLGGVVNQPPAQRTGGGPVNNVLGEIPRFNGKGNFPLWYKQFQASCVLYGLTTADQQLPVLKRCLVGEAFNWKELREHENANDTAQQFVTALTNEYQGDQRERNKRAKSAFMKAVKHPSEDYKAYFRRLRALAIQIDPEPGADDFIDRFKESVPQEGRDHVIKSAPADRAQLLAAVTKLDEISVAQQYDLAQLMQQPVPKTPDNRERRRSSSSSRKYYRRSSGNRSSSKRDSEKKKKFNALRHSKKSDHSSSESSSESGSSSSEDEISVKKLTKQLSKLKTEIADLKNPSGKSKKINNIRVASRERSNSRGRTPHPSADRMRRRTPERRSYRPRSRSRSYSRSFSRSYSRSRGSYPRSGKIINSLIEANSALAKQRLCYKCNSPDHIIRQCPDNRDTRYRENRSRDRYNSRSRDRGYNRSRNDRSYSRDRNRDYNRNSHYRDRSRDRVHFSDPQKSEGNLINLSENK